MNTIIDINLATQNIVHCIVKKMKVLHSLSHIELKVCKKLKVFALKPLPMEIMVQAKKWGVITPPLSSKLYFGS